MEQAKIDVIKFKKEDVIATSGTGPAYKHIIDLYGLAVGLVDLEGDGFTSADVGAAIGAANYGITYFASTAALNAIGYYFDDPRVADHIYEYSYTSSDGKWHFVECTNYVPGPTATAGTHFTP